MYLPRSDSSFLLQSLSSWWGCYYKSKRATQHSWWRHLDQCGYVHHLGWHSESTSWSPKVQSSSCFPIFSEKSSITVQPPTTIGGWFQGARKDDPLLDSLDLIMPSCYQSCSMLRAKSSDYKWSFEPYTPWLAFPYYWYYDKGVEISYLSSSLCLSDLSHSWIQRGQCWRRTYSGYSSHWFRNWVDHCVPNGICCVW